MHSSLPTTTIAEKLGDEKYHQLLKEFFADITNPILDNKGEIYQYVGDEVVIAWKYENGIENNRVIECFFNMKKVVIELKKISLEILKNPSTASAAAAMFANEAILHDMPAVKELEKSMPSVHSPVPQPMIYNGEDIHDHVEVEESLNIMDKEKELIEKALKKHKGKRKDAASDLGISERTLYRKLKEYNIEE